MTIVGTALPLKKDSLLMHLNLIVWSQKPLIGLQEIIETRMTVIHQAMTTAPMRLGASLNVRVENTLR